MSGLVTMEEAVTETRVPGATSDQAFSVVEIC